MGDVQANGLAKGDPILAVQWVRGTTSALPSPTDTPDRCDLRKNEDAAALNMEG